MSNFHEIRGGTVVVPWWYGDDTVTSGVIPWRYLGGTVSVRDATGFDRGGSVVA